jgi:hypothetical protein
LVDSDISSVLFTQSFRPYPENGVVLRSPLRDLSLNSSDFAEMFRRFLQVSSAAAGHEELSQGYLNAAAEAIEAGDAQRLAYHALMAMASVVGPRQLLLDPELGIAILDAPTNTEEATKVLRLAVRHLRSSTDELPHRLAEYIASAFESATQLPVGEEPKPSMRVVIDNLARGLNLKIPNRNKERPDFVTVGRAMDDWIWQWSQGKSEMDEPIYDRACMELAKKLKASKSRIKSRYEEYLSAAAASNDTKAPEARAAFIAAANSAVASQRRKR